MLVQPVFEPTTSRTVVRYLTNWANRLAGPLVFIFKISNLNLLSNTVIRHSDLSHELGYPVVVSLRMLPTAQANLRLANNDSCENRTLKSNKKAKQGAVRRNRNENTLLIVSSLFVFPFYLCVAFVRTLHIDKNTRVLLRQADAKTSSLRRLWFFLSEQSCGESAKLSGKATGVLERGKRNSGFLLP